MSRQGVGAANRHRRHAAFERKADAPRQLAQFRAVYRRGDAAESARRFADSQPRSAAAKRRRALRQQWLGLRQRGDCRRARAAGRQPPFPMGRAKPLLADARDHPRQIRRDGRVDRGRADRDAWLQPRRGLDAHGDRCTAFHRVRTDARSGRSAGLHGRRQARAHARNNDFGADARRRGSSGTPPLHEPLRPGGGQSVHWPDLDRAKGLCAARRQRRQSAVASDLDRHRPGAQRRRCTSRGRRVARDPVGEHDRCRSRRQCDAGRCDRRAERLDSQDCRLRCAAERKTCRTAGAARWQPQGVRLDAWRCDRRAGADAGARPGGDRAARLCCKFERQLLADQPQGTLARALADPGRARHRALAADTVGPPRDPASVGQRGQDRHGSGADDGFCKQESGR